MRRIRFTDWLAGHARARARVEQIQRAFAQPYRRERPRDPEKARLLRERGTPEHLIGPAPRMGQRGWLPDHSLEWREEFKRTTPGRRVAGAIAISRTATRIAAATAHRAER
jgi:hypothetical protein